MWLQRLKSVEFVAEIAVLLLVFSIAILRHWAETCVKNLVRIRSLINEYKRHRK